ncbi:MAG TPA: serine protease [Verrucomicrobiae bacterium]|nr:serine protease [Verrucomicrobiae bacterium]
MRRKSLVKGSALFFSFAALGCLLTGCISPDVKVTAKGGADFASYRKVYLPKFKSDTDPRHVEPRVWDRLEKAGFEVVAVDPDKPEIDSQGTGFVISTNGYLLTCAHVIGDATNATAWIEHRRYQCEVVSTDTNFDVTLLRIRGSHPDFHPLLLDSTAADDLGQDVFALGFPLVDLLGSSPRLNKGVISAAVGMNDETNHLQFSAPVQPGNSGGPLLEPGGRVVGIVQSSLNGGSLLAESGAYPQNVNFAVKVNVLRQFVQGLKVALPATNQPTALAGAEKSLALVRAGDVSDADLKRPALVCFCTYLSTWNWGYHFRAIQIEFFDLKKNESILKVGQYQPDTSSENAALDRLFGRIRVYFFPKGSPAAKTD